LVTVEGARRYGVVMTPKGSVDHDATSGFRAQLNSGRVSPACSIWPARPEASPPLSRRNRAPGAKRPSSIVAAAKTE
jgi:hypothetical protein